MRRRRGRSYGRTSLFFFQAEDGIRDLTVTGVQTCALPISVVAICYPCCVVVFVAAATCLERLGIHGQAWLFVPGISAAGIAAAFGVYWALRDRKSVV